MGGRPPAPPSPPPTPPSPPRPPVPPPGPLLPLPPLPSFCGKALSDMAFKHRPSLKSKVMPGANCAMWTWWAEQGGDCHLQTAAANAHAAPGCINGHLVNTTSSI